MNPSLDQHTWEMLRAAGLSLVCLLWQAQLDHILWLAAPKTKEPTRTRRQAVCQQTKSKILVLPKGRLRQRQPSLSDRIPVTGSTARPPLGSRLLSLHPPSQACARNNNPSVTHEFRGRAITIGSVACWAVLHRAKISGRIVSQGCTLSRLDVAQPCTESLL